MSFLLGFKSIFLCSPSDTAADAGDLSFPEIRSGMKLLHLQGSVTSLQADEWCAGFAHFNPACQLVIAAYTPG
jgi:hypothetical protein